MKYTFLFPAAGTSLAFRCVAPFSFLFFIRLPLVVYATFYTKDKDWQ